MNIHRVYARFSGICVDFIKCTQIQVCKRTRHRDGTLYRLAALSFSIHFMDCTGYSLWNVKNGRVLVSMEAEISDVKRSASALHLRSLLVLKRWSPLEYAFSQGNIDTGPHDGHNSTAVGCFWRAVCIILRCVYIPDLIGRLCQQSVPTVLFLNFCNGTRRHSIHGCSTLKNGCRHRYWGTRPTQFMALLKWKMSADIAVEPQTSPVQACVCQLAHAFVRMKR